MLRALWLVGSYEILTVSTDKSHGYCSRLGSWFASFSSTLLRAFNVLFGLLSHKCLMFNSATYLSGLSWSIFQIIVLSSIDTDAGSLFVRISRCVLWKKMTSPCPKNQLMQMKSGTLLLSSCGDDGREGTTFANPACRGGICNLIRYFSQNWVCYFVFPSLIMQPTSIHLF